VILADDAGKMRRLAIRREPSPRLIAEAETLLDQPIIATPASTGDAVIVATADHKIRSLSTRDLSPVGSWPLNAPLVDPPRAIGGRVFVYLEDGGVICFGPEGRRLWEITLGAPAVGDPAIIHDRAWIIDRNGRLHECALADGAIGRTIDLQILPAGGLTMAGSQAIIPVALGAVRTLSLEAATNPEDPAKEANRP
jgi:hypothetical protein